MSADLLRRAAAKIRETAEGVTLPGPWAAGWQDPKRKRRYLFDWPTHRRDPDNSRPIFLDGVAPGDAEHFLVWQPDVALMIAGWIDGSARDLKMAGSLSGCDEPGSVQKHIDLANLILGEDS